MPKEGQIGAQLVSSGVTLEFVWRGDRFEHAIRCGDREIAATASSDFETPVFQEVHQQGDLVFASGMSGTLHWSASFEPADDGLLVDLACRCKAAHQPLAAVYRGEGLTISSAESFGSDCIVALEENDEPFPRTARRRYRIAA